MYSNQAYDFYLLRTPAYSVDQVLALNSLLESLRGLEDQEQLKRLFADPLFQEAILLSSPNLYASLQQWLKGEMRAEKKIASLLQTLHKYYSRMGTRCTPYGVLAGCSVGHTTHNPTGIDFHYRNLHRASRLDMGLAGRLAKELEAAPEVRNFIKFYLNSSVYLLNNKYRYVEYKYNGTAREYVLSSLSRSRYLDLVHRESRAGATKQQLAAALTEASQGKLTTEKINEFIEKLISYQFLISELDIRVTGQNYADYVTQKLASFTTAVPQVASLVQEQNLLNLHNTGVATYLQVAEWLQSSFVTKEAVLIQTDLFYEHRNQLSASVVEEITRTAEELSSLTEPYAPPALQEFVQQFSARYENQEVPLALALDAEVGLGYGNARNGNIEELPLLRGLRLPVSAAAEAVLSSSWEKLAQKKYTEHCRSGSLTVEISEQDLSELKKARPDKTFAHSSFIMGTLLAGSVADLDSGAYTFLVQGLNTPFAARILGRFAVGNEELAERLRQCLAEEQAAHPEALLAEILHVPDDRLCNVIIRPTLRAYEIPYLCNPSVGVEGTIAIDDLFLRLAAGRLVLTSKKLGREIIPCLTNSHNTFRSIALYRFLCDLQYQHLRKGFEWNWSSLRKESFLPRVTYKKLILSRARWYLPRLASSSQADQASGHSYVGLLRQQLSFPRYVLMQQSDNELLLDLDSELGQQHLLRQLRQQDAVLVEHLATRANCFIEDAQGNRFTHEIVIPVHRAHREPLPSPQAADAARVAPAKQLTRDFMPGSNWLYVKLYAGHKTLEQVLSNTILPLASRLLSSQAIDKWFFIKYYDPDSHLRLRFYSRNGNRFIISLLEDIQAELSPLLENKTIQQVSVDTYSREIERYGWRTMEASESIFMADSQAIGQAIQLVLCTGDERLRWLAGAYSVDSLLNSFSYSPKAKQELLDTMRRAFFYEFNQNLEPSESNLLRSLNDKYRADQPFLESMLLAGAGEKNKRQVQLLFQERETAIQAQVLAIRTVAENYPAEAIELNDLLQSYIHMSLNRLFIARQRAHELIIYHYLYKHYTTVIKKDASKPVNA